MKGFVALAIIFLTIIAAFVISIGLVSSYAVKMSKSAEDFIDDYYTHYNTQDYEYIYYSLTDEKYKSATDYDSFVGSMKKIYKTLGPIENKEKGPSKLSCSTGGLYFSIQYKTGRKNDVLEESFTLKRHSDRWLLAQSQIEARALTAAWQAQTVEIELGFNFAKMRRGAILPFDGPDKKIASIATDIFSEEFIAKGGYQIIKQVKLDEVLKELGISTFDISDIHTIMKIGKMLDVEVILVGFVYPVYEHGQFIFGQAPIKEVRAINLDVRLLNVESGGILWSNNKQSAGALASYVSVDEQIRGISKNIIDDFMKKLKEG